MERRRYFNYRTNKNSKTEIHLHWLIVEKVKKKRGVAAHK